MKVLIFLIAVRMLAALPIEVDNIYNKDVNQNKVHIHKQFFTHTGPEGPLERKISLGKALKNFRVLFINIPSPYAQQSQNGVKRLQVSLAPVEEKLALYVLSPMKTKQELEIVNFERTLSEIPLAPEVHFVKYKDERDELETRQRIRDHYLALD